MQTKVRLVQWLLFLVVMLAAGCSANQGASNSETATAQAGRIVGLATQMGGHAQATLAAQNQQVTATAAARQSLLPEARQWRLLFSDTFDDDLSGWAKGEDEDPGLGAMSWSIEDGKYQWKGSAHSGFVWWVIPDVENISDFYLSVSARQIGQPEVGEYGLVFRQAGDEDYYLFEISELGMYALYLHTAIGWEKLIDWTSHPSITPGNSKKLVVVARGASFSFFINEVFVAEFNDDRLPEGKAGLLVGLTNSGESASWEFDDFELRIP